MAAGNKYLIYGILLVVLFGAACIKRVEYPELPDYEPPVIKVTTPINQSSKNSEEPVHIVGSVVDNLALKNMSITVMTADSFKKVQHFTRDLTGKKGYVFHEQYLMPLPDGVVAQFIIAIAATDSAGNTGNDSLLYIAY